MEWDGVSKPSSLPRPWIQEDVVCYCWEWSDGAAALIQNKDIMLYLP